MNEIKNMNSDYRIRRSQIAPTVQPATEQTKHNNFNAILNKIQSTDQVKFSKHAIDRLNARNIELSSDDMSRINSGVDRAKNKGVRDALIMMDNKVFVASVQNKTIITAAMDEQLKDSVFTNIDGAVIV